ncbi:MAG: glycoside hydrolase family 43 protein [Acidothermaceae bacterium]
MTRTFRNPILPGSYPDPSICRVDNDYYLVTSTFEYFPALPVHHSRDLVNWRPIGHVIDRPDQLDLDHIKPSDGLYAPTIRYAAGLFYVVCTLVRGHSDSGNFVITAQDPAGPWSDPVWLRDAEGFDPSLLFDDDGGAWFCATKQEDSDGHTVVWVQEFDPDALKLMGERHEIWHGALRDARWSEAPHIYNVDGSYYLLTAEGGTSQEHAVMVARSDHPTGPYTGCPRNPVFTARHLAGDSPVVATGHADLVSTPDGEWWSVLLGVRDDEKGCLGRETFLTPLRWHDDGWPVFSPGHGVVRLEESCPALPETLWPSTPRCDSFDDPHLRAEWMMIRSPREAWWSLSERPGHLRLRVRPETLTQQGNPSFVGRRLQHRDFAAFACVDFSPTTETECAGIALVHSDAFQVRLEISGVSTRQAKVIRRSDGEEHAVATIAVTGNPLRIGVEARGARLEFRVAEPGRCWKSVAVTDASHLSYRHAGGFFGVLVGVFATDEGAPKAPITNVADFDWFEYGPITGDGTDC